jgi:Flp pilus assembly protein TadD
MPADSSDPITAKLKLAAQSLSAGQPAEAVLICREALTRSPHDPQVLYALGVSLAQTGQIDDAIASYQDAIRHRPDFFEAYTNLGTMLGAKGKPGEAIEAFTQAARLRPGIAELHANLSNAYREMWKLDEAVASARRAIELKPALGEAYLCLGAALAIKGKFDQAIETYRQAIQIRPDFPAAHLNLALAELVTGNLQSAWPEYEWRRKCPGVLAPRSFSEPKWNGETLAGKTILLHSEQGLGDAIHFIRYAPILADRGANVLVQCPQPLVRIVQTVAGVNQVIPTGQPLPRFDFQIALPSLPGVFNSTLDSIPATIPYMVPEPAESATWRDRLQRAPGVSQVGLVWAGNPENRNDRNRSIPLQKLAPILEISGVRFHSLQIKPPSANPFPIQDWSTFLTDFGQTAALIANLDLVISVDTAPAHLAAAMGKRVWLLISFPPDWRWMLDRNDSPWYPTMRLFRQTTPGDWTAPIQSAAQALGKFKAE